MQNCNPSNEQQKFVYTTNDFANPQQPFELKPRYLPVVLFGPGGEWCVTQPHHPKSKEPFGIRDCSQ